MKGFLYCFLLVQLFACGQGKKALILPNDPHFGYTGRIDYSNTQSYRFSYPGVSIRAKFTGNHCVLLLRNQSQDSTYHNYYQVIVDGQAPTTLAVGNRDKKHTLTLLPNRPTHTILIFKRTESLVGEGIFEGLELDKGSTLLHLDSQLTRRIEFIGNSITCGYGNEGDSPNCHFSPETENAYLSYAAITARNLQADHVMVAYSGKGVVQNYELNDKETLPFLYDRINPYMPSPQWTSQKWIPHVVVINLGTNDFAHHVPDSALFISTYVAFIEKLHRQYPKASFFCIEGCMTKDGWPEGIFSFSTVKRYIEKAAAISRSKGIKDLFTYFPTSMQQGEIGCDWHPNIIRHKKMAEELTNFIQQKIGW